MVRPRPKKRACSATTSSPRRTTILSAEISRDTRATLLKIGAQRAAGARRAATGLPYPSPHPVPKIGPQRTDLIAGRPKEGHVRRRRNDGESEGGGCVAVELASNAVAAADSSQPC